MILKIDKLKKSSGSYIPVSAIESLTLEFGFRLPPIQIDVVRSLL
jgi:hypothetical protein